MSRQRVLHKIVAKRLKAACSVHSAVTKGLLMTLGLLNDVIPFRSNALTYYTL